MSVVLHEFQHSRLEEFLNVLDVIGDNEPCLVDDREIQVLAAFKQFDNDALVLRAQPRRLEGGRSFKILLNSVKLHSYVPDIGSIFSVFSQGSDIVGKFLLHQNEAGFELLALLNERCL